MGNENIYTASKHYDLLATIEEDSEELSRYMSQWDGKLFYKALQPYKNRNFLEVGVGLGRLAKPILNGGGCLTGLDISKKSLECAEVILDKFKDRLTLINENILNYNADNEFDVVFVVLTLLHIENKELALKNMINALVENGKLVLSVELPDKDYANSYFDDGVRKYKPEYWPNNVESILNIIKSNGCEIESIETLIRTNSDDSNMGKPLSKLITAVKK